MLYPNRSLNSPPLKSSTLKTWGLMLGLLPYEVGVVTAECQLELGFLLSIYLSLHRSPQIILTACTPSIPKSLSSTVEVLGNSLNLLLSNNLISMHRKHWKFAVLVLQVKVVPYSKKLRSSKPLGEQSALLVWVCKIDTILVYQSHVSSQSRECLMSLGSSQAPGFLPHSCWRNNSHPHPTTSRQQQRWNGM